MIMNFIDLNKRSNEDIRWLFSLKAIDSFFNSFSYKDEEKFNLMNRLRIAFGEEFGMSQFLRKQLNLKYRNERKKIDLFMNFGKIITPK